MSSQRCLSLAWDRLLRVRPSHISQGCSILQALCAYKNLKKKSCTQVAPIPVFLHIFSARSRLLNVGSGACSKAQTVFHSPAWECASPEPSKNDSPLCARPALPARPTICKYWERLTLQGPCWVQRNEARSWRFQKSAKLYGLRSKLYELNKVCSLRFTLDVALIRWSSCIGTQSQGPGRGIEEGSLFSFDVTCFALMISLGLPQYCCKEA